MSAQALKSFGVNALYVLLALLIFGILIFVHELGHYLTARAFHVEIKEFAIGMGKRIVSYTSQKTGIVYSLRLFPVGGFVSMAGEDEESDSENALNKKPAWQRFIITSAGAVTNITVGIIVMIMLVTFSSELLIGSTTIAKFDEDHELTTAVSSGLMIGDSIEKINGKRVYYSQDLVYTILEECTSAVDITVERNGETVVLEDVIFPTYEERGNVYGDIFFTVSAIDKNVGNVLGYSLRSSFSTIEMIWDSLIGMLTGKFNLSDVSGPVGTTTIVAQTAKRGVPNLTYLCVFITMNLGVFNLLPLPALDGGRLVFITIEMIRRKPINPKYEAYVHFAGIVFLMLLMVVITFKDVISLF